MKNKAEKFTVSKATELFAQQGYDFNKIRKNVLIYNYDEWRWFAGSFFGNRGLMMPYADQIQRVAQYINNDARFAGFDLAGLAMAGVDEYGARDGMKIIEPKLETVGLHHVYNVIVRDAQTGKFIPMSKGWAYGGLFDDRRYLVTEIVGTVVMDLCARDDSVRQVIFDGLAKQR